MQGAFCGCWGPARYGRTGVLPLLRRSMEVQLAGVPGPTLWTIPCRLGLLGTGCGVLLALGQRWPWQCSTGHVTAVHRMCYAAVGWWLLPFGTFAHDVASKIWLCMGFAHAQWRLYGALGLPRRIEICVCTRWAGPRRKHLLTESRTQTCRRVCSSSRNEKQQSNGSLAARAALQLKKKATRTIQNHNCLLPAQVRSNRA